MNILFLDIDGVVNTPINNTIGTITPNNINAINLVSKFCLEHNFDIVISSTWRLNRRDPNCRKCLVAAGLDPRITILGSTPYIHSQRGREIQSFLSGCDNVENFIILDDEDFDMLPEQMSHVVKTEFETGFTQKEFDKCVALCTCSPTAGGA